MNKLFFEVDFISLFLKVNSFSGLKSVRLAISPSFSVGLLIPKRVLPLVSSATTSSVSKTVFNALKAVSKPIVP